MKMFILFCFVEFILLTGCATSSQNTTSSWKEDVSIHFDSTLAPFYHGVASGDPLSDRVIIWTRVTPKDSTTNISVKWEIAEDESFTSIYKSDSLTTNRDHDFTVKVDVDALKPDRIYFYRFTALGKTSIAGRTKTAPVKAKDSVKFAVVSCANWEWGYFNAYDRIADRPILDAVIHLGDYIYEYATGKYGDTTIHRINIPSNEIVSLGDYRTRYSLYRLDQGLRRVHQMHPFITIWDDHEIANNSYVSGAQNHQQEEGDYNKRKAAARQAYYEWLPIRESGKHYRTFSFGPLADLLMLDERLAGRTKQADSVADPRFSSKEQTMLGAEQLAWFEQNLNNSKAVWKVIGNQVIFSNVEQKAVFPKMPRNLDSWDGYPIEKKKIMDFIQSNTINNIIFLTGDTHASWAIEATDEIKKNYAPFAVELGTTSISSSNGNENKTDEEIRKAEEALMYENAHVKYINDRDHGYLLVTLYPTKTKAEWFYVETLREVDNKESLGKRFEVNRETNRLKPKD